jgi:hypothetical protein
MGAPLPFLMLWTAPHRHESAMDAIDVVDDARSRHRMCQRGDR